MYASVSRGPRKSGSEARDHMGFSAGASANSQTSPFGPVTVGMPRHPGGPRPHKSWERVAIWSRGGGGRDPGKLQRSTRGPFSGTPG